MECLECVIVIPAYPAKCNRVILPGGIKAFVLAKCGTNFDLITDLDEWCDKKNSGLIAATSMRRVLGNIPEAEEAVGKLGSCDPDELLSLRHTCDILDHNSEDPIDGASQDAFYNWLNDNYQKLQVGFITCDDRFYGWVQSFSVTCKRVIENNNFEGKTFWHAVFKWDQKGHLVPTLIPGLGDAIENCVVVPPTPNAFRAYCDNGSTQQRNGQLTEKLFYTNQTFYTLFNIPTIGVPVAGGTYDFYGNGNNFTVKAVFQPGSSTDFTLRLEVRDDAFNLTTINFPGTVLNTDTWLGLGLVKTGDHFEVYVNGLSIGSGDFSIPGAEWLLLPDDTNPVTLGSTFSCNSGNGLTAVYFDNVYGWDSAMGAPALLAMHTTAFPAGWVWGLNFNGGPANPVPPITPGQASLDIYNLVDLALQFTIR